MDKRKISIGRDPKSDIVVPATCSVVSGSHADVEIEDGHYVYVDHSTNGSTVGDKRLHNSRMAVVAGTQIMLAGKYALDWSEVKRLLPLHPKTAPLPQSVPTTVGGPISRTPIPSGGPVSDGRPVSGSRPSGGRISQGPRHVAGELFNNRFRLVRRLGSGASASVWEARDTLTEGMPVAVKIFSLNRGVDSKGLQNLQREFVTSYEMSQPNLLTPRYYDVCQGQPFLVMQYCSRGSATKLIGKASEEQVIKLLHDVAAGLEYLHAHKIIHQDIKPDNILQGDNGNFLISDFGISATIDALNDDKDMAGGTNVYMVPERFKGENGSASDIWSLGATAYELVTGEPPCGDVGGVSLDCGGEVKPIARALKPQVKELIMRCLETKPDKRPTAEEIRKKIDIYYETGGRWERKDNVKRALIVAVAVLAVALVAAGYWFWDSHRLKSSYYADFVEIEGVPVGIGKVDRSNRPQSIMIQKQGGKVVRMANVNSAGTVVPYDYPRQGLLRFVDVAYRYDGDGALIGKTVSDEYGRELFKMEVKGSDVSFFYPVDGNKPMLLLSDMGSNFRMSTDLNFYKDYSNTTGYKLEFDSSGFVKSVRYKNHRGLTADRYGVSGTDYTYDDQGHLASSQYLGLDGTHAAGPDGVSLKTYEYDSFGNLSDVRHSDLLLNPTLNSHGYYRMHVTRADQTVTEEYFDTNNRRVANTAIGAARVERDYDSRGMLVQTRYYDASGEPVPGPQGATVVISEPDAQGRAVRVAYEDSHGSPVGKGGSKVNVERFDYDGRGLPVEARSFRMERGKEEPCEDTKYVHLTRYGYDQNGCLDTVAYYGHDGRPTMASGLYHKLAFGYDGLKNVTSLTAYDPNGRPAALPNDPSLSSVKMEYDLMGCLTSQTNLLSGQTVRSGTTLVASTDYKYVEDRLASKAYHDVDGSPTVNALEGVDSLAYEYSHGMLSRMTGYAGQKQLFDASISRDSKGTRLTVKNATGRPNSEFGFPAGDTIIYDANRRMVRQAFSSAPMQHPELGEVVAVDYVYKPGGTVEQVCTLKSGAKHTLTVSPDNRGRVGQVDFGGQYVKVYDYDPAGRDAGHHFLRNGFPYQWTDPKSGASYCRLSRSYGLDDGLLAKMVYSADMQGDEPCRGPKGYAWCEYAYDGNRKPTQARYYKKDDHLPYTNMYTGYNARYQLTDVDKAFPGTQKVKVVIKYLEDGVTPHTMNAGSSTYYWDDATKSWQPQAQAIMADLAIK